MPQKEVYSVNLLFQCKRLPKPERVVMRYPAPTLKKPDYKSDAAALLRNLEDDVMDVDSEDVSIPSDRLPKNV